MIPVSTNTCDYTSPKTNLDDYLYYAYIVTVYRMKQYQFPIQICLVFLCPFIVQKLFSRVDQLTNELILIECSASEHSIICNALDKCTSHSQNVHSEKGDRISQLMPGLVNVRIHHMIVLRKKFNM